MIDLSFFVLVMMMMTTILTIGAKAYIYIPMVYGRWELCS